MRQTSQLHMLANQAPCANLSLTATLTEIKQHLAQGTLIAAMQSGSITINTPERPSHVKLTHEKHRRDSSTLILEFSYPSDAPRQLVVQQARTTPPSTLNAWWYPDDPHLPALPQIITRTALDQAYWDHPLPFAGHTLSAKGISQLIYNPGQRASFLLNTGITGQQFVVKALRPEQFQASLERAHIIENSGLNRTIAIPRLISYSRTNSMLLYEYLPGTPIVQLPANQLQSLATWLSTAAAGVLARIHALELPNLPLWDPDVEISRTRLLLADLAAQHPAIAALWPVFDHLTSQLCAAPHAPRYLTHSDFSARNVLMQTSRPGQQRLAVIDWDSAMAGPPERDLAAFQRGAGHGAALNDQLLITYQRRRSQRVDRQLITCFSQYQRVLKYCRQTLKDGARANDAERLAAAISQALHIA